MSAIAVTPVYTAFIDVNGTPIDDGYIYIGQPNLNPVTNPQNAYWDEALTQLAAQPIRTRQGYPLNGSSVGKLYVAGSYSLLVRNENGSDVIGAATFSADHVIDDLDLTGTLTLSALTASTALALNANKEVVSVTNTGTGNNVLATGPTITSPIISSGNLTFSATSQRITGDFSNATTSNRLAFQSSTVNGNTGINVLPNGTATTSGISVYNANDPSNAAFGILQATATQVNLASTVNGAGSLLPLSIQTGGTERFRIETTGSITSSNLADAVGYKGVPINEQSAAYGLQLTDQGKSIVHPITDNNARTFTIPANGTVPFPVGTTITFINLINTVTIAITTDTMYLAGSGATGSRTLAAYGMATAVKVSSTSWIISGNGLT